MSDNKVNFTAKNVAGFRCEEGKQAAFLWDTSASGLGLKASAGGSKRYVLQSRLESGATVRVTIGDPKAWTLSAARDEARRLQTLIDRGIDPRQEKADRIAAADAKRAEDEAKRVEAQRIEAPLKPGKRTSWHVRRSGASALCLTISDLSTPAGNPRPEAAGPARATRRCPAHFWPCWIGPWNR